jgi:transposase
VIERKLQVRFHPRYLNAWLKRRGITPQKPERQARQRDQAAVTHWLAHAWPRIQNARAAAGRIWP